ncbi:MAG TPA: dienelactone hydrolase family protein [Xanthobacteraceae bacterium]|nr:dienelactone hydrolase family protein [Xanthobacteraceae bacterium]
MTVERISYHAGGKRFVGALVYDERLSGKRPLLLVAPNWLGVTDDAIKRTQMMAVSRFIGFVADMYGDGKVSAGPPEAAQLADTLRADAKERRLRIGAALAALVSESEQRQIGDISRKAAVGFCFGGGNVLELARAGENVQAVVSLHGDLTSPITAKPGDIKAALLVVHGAADPVSPKEQRDAFENEMEAAKASWQMLTFGHLVHSFCEPEADVPGIAEYNEAAARQSYRLIDQFIADAFEGRIVKK